MAIIYVFVWCFGFWTLLCNAAFACHLNLLTLRHLAPFPLVAGVICGLLVARRSKIGSLNDFDTPKPSFHWPWLIVAILISAMRLRNGHFGIFWLASLLYLLAWLLVGPRVGGESKDQPTAPIGKRNALILL